MPFLPPNLQHQSTEGINKKKLMAITSSILRTHQVQLHSKNADRSVRLTVLLKVASLLILAGWLISHVDKCVRWQIKLCDPVNTCHTEHFSGESDSVSHKKGDIQLMAITSSNLNQFSQIFSLTDSL